jgi:hypothetical protein
MTGRRKDPFREILNSKHASPAVLRVANPWPFRDQQTIDGELYAASSACIPVAPEAEAARGADVDVDRDDANRIVGMVIPFLTCRSGTSGPASFHPLRT